MKKYEKPILIENEIELEDVVAASLVTNTTDGGVMESVTDFFGGTE